MTVKSARSARRRSLTGGHLYDFEPLITPKSRTPVTVGAGDNPLLADLIRDWDEVFPEKTPDQGMRIETSPRVRTWLVGAEGPTFVWRGTAHFLVGQPVGAPVTSWTWRAASPEEPLDSPTNDVLRTVDWVATTLGMTERDVLRAAGISERTYYNWKSNRTTSPRLNSQADLWALVHSVSNIVDALDDDAARWIKTDPSRRELFVDGQHGKLAALALATAATAEDVRIPSDTLDRLGIVASSDPTRLKQFRADYPVRFTHDENGNRLPRASNLEAAFHDEDAEDDLLLIDVDD